MAEKVKTDNLYLWSQVDSTDPAVLKKVNSRGGFTAICAHSQIMRATEMFGPVGEGWGWELTKEYPPNGTVLMEVSLWRMKGKDKLGGPTQFGCAPLSMGSKPDTDCHKKALTDGLTKCLSYWGFNADVFLGKFDDNKYVQEQIKAHAKKDDTKPEEKPVKQEQQQNDPDQVVLFNKIKTAMIAAKDPQDLQNIWMDSETERKSLPEVAQTELKWERKRLSNHLMEESAADPHQ